MSTRWIQTTSSSADGRGHRGTRAKSLVSATLRGLHRLAAVLATVVLCAGLVSSERGLASLLEAVGVASRETTSVDGQPAARASSREWRERAARATPELTAVEPDPDEIFPQWDPRDGAPRAVRFDTFWRPVERAWRGEVSVDPSTFDAGTGFPRGPPPRPGALAS